MSDMGNKSSNIDTRVTEYDLELAKKVAHLRFVSGTFGMAEDNLSEYVRALIRNDAALVINEIKSRRKT